MSVDKIPKSPINNKIGSALKENINKHNMIEEVSNNFNNI